METFSAANLRRHRAHYDVTAITYYRHEIDKYTMSSLAVALHHACGQNTQTATSMHSMDSNTIDAMYSHCSPLNMY